MAKANLNPSNERLTEQLLNEPYCRRDYSLKIYEAKFQLDLVREVQQREGHFIWYDFCCGGFYAGRDFLKGHHGQTDNLRIVGVDVIKQLALDPPLIFEKANAASYQLRESPDLITCHNGLKYIEKYFKNTNQVIQQWHEALKQGGTLAFNAYGEALAERLEEQLGEQAVVRRETLNNGCVHFIARIVKRKTLELVLSD